MNSPAQNGDVPWLRKRLPEGFSMFFSAFSWRSHGVPRPLALSIERDGEMRARGDGLGHVLGDRGRARLLEISWKKMGEPQQNTPKNIQKTTKKWKNIYNKACSRYIL